MEVEAVGNHGELSYANYSRRVARATYKWDRRGEPDPSEGFTLEKALKDLTNGEPVDRDAIEGMVTRARWDLEP